MLDFNQAHDASVTKLGWANPEFGNVLISAGLDQTIRVWEEEEEAKGKKWMEKAKIQEKGIQEMRIGPHWQGLKLGVVTANGRFKVYEAPDVLNVSTWTLVEDLLVSAVLKEGADEYTFDWCYSKSWAMSAAISTGKETGVKIYRVDSVSGKFVFSESLRGHTDLVTCIAWAPCLGRSFQLIATGCRDMKLRIFKVTEDKNKKLVAEVLSEIKCVSEIWRLEWNITGTMLASADASGVVNLWKQSFKGPFTNVKTINPDQDKGLSLSEYKM